MVLRIKLSQHNYTTVISAYAPTMPRSEISKDAVHEELNNVILETQKNDELII